MIDLPFVKLVCVHWIGAGFISCCIILFALGAVAQKSAIGSSYQTEPLIGSVTTINRLYDQVFEEITLKDFDHALLHIDQAQNLSHRLPDSLWMVKTSRVKGQILKQLDRMEDARIEFERVLPVAKRNSYTNEYEYILNSLAVVHTLLANYDDALEFNLECLQARIPHGNKEQISITLNNIGIIYYNLGQYEKALDYYKRSSIESDSIDFKERLLINMALCYNGLSNFHKAREFVMEGYKICGDNCSDHTIIQGEFGLGTASLGLGEPGDAKKHFAISLELSKKQNDKRLQIDNLISLGNAEIAMGQYSPCTKNLKEAEEIAAKGRYNESLISIYSSYSRAYERMGQYRNAAGYQNKYIRLKDSIYSSDLTKNLMRIQSEFEERENLTKIASQEKILKLNDTIIVKQIRLNILIGIITILFIILAVVYYKLSQQRKNANITLDKKVQERTLALEESLSELLRKQQEQSQLLNGISNDMKASVATIRGLCNLATIEDASQAEYAKEFTDTASRITEIIKRIQTMKEGEASNELK